jgi:diguanylate cyclase (GGDEF)-like protein
MDAKSNTQIWFSTIPSPAPPVDADTSDPAILYLIVVRGGIPGTMLRLAQSASSIGRSAENTFQLHDATVSRRHAVISIDAAGKAWIMDLGSTNGTYVDGERIPLQTPIRIKDGSRIQLGSSTLLKYLKLDPCEEGFQREMFERSVRDNLTGLYNRGYFLGQIGPLAEINAMCELGLAVILVDIDHFKRINDNFGHDVGDQVLREVAEVLRSSARHEDLVARYGGEEFILALPSSSLEQAIERAEKIRTQLSCRHLDSTHSRVPVTASLGVSFTSEPRADKLSNLISAADEALYEAKRAGRNQVVTACKKIRETIRKTESADAFAIL